MEVKLINILESIDSSIILSLLLKFFTILSFGITIAVYLTVRKIRTKFFIKARLPEQISKFSNLISELTEMKQDYENNKGNIKYSIIKINESILWFKKNLTKEFKPFITKIINFDSVNNEKLFDEYHLLCFQLREKIDLYYKDLKWRDNG